VPSFGSPEPVPADDQGRIDPGARRDRPAMIDFVELWVYLSGSPLLWLTATLVAYLAADGAKVRMKYDYRHWDPAANKEYAEHYDSESLNKMAVMGALFLHENVSPLRIAGTVLVIFGCVLIARSA